MADQRKARIINKHATPAKWKEVEASFKPLAAEFIVYDNSDKPKIKLGDNTRTLNNLPYITKGMVPNDESLSYNADGTISLKKEYRDYLDAQTFAYPTISEFNIVGTNVRSNVEVGTEVTVTGFEHTETNSTNIVDKKLTLTSNKNSSINLTVTASDTKASVDIEPDNSYKFETNTTLTYTLAGKDKRGNDITKSYNISSYYPSFIGTKEGDSISASDISSLTKVSSSSLKGNRTLTIDSDARYFFFVTTTKINTITDGPVNFSYMELDTLNLSINNTTNKKYYVYRSTNRLTESYTLTIT